jgi:hypothetical protein
MSQQAVQQESRPDSHSKSPTPAEAARTHRDVPYLLSQMTYEERVRAYTTRAFSARELSTAAALHPEAMPTLNGEFEHIAIFLADHD